MYGNGQIKRKPGRPWGSTSKKKFGSGSNDSAFKSWTSRYSHKAAARGKPPGRPWHSNTATKVCLLCLHQYNQSAISPEASSDEEDEDVEDVADSDSRDPLADDGGTSVALQKITTIGSVKIPKAKKTSLYLRFLMVLNRHLQMKTKRFKDSAQRNELSAPFCENCLKTVKQLCKGYEEMQNAKLGLQWRLKQISDSIKLSKVSVTGKLQCTLLKSLSTQLRVTSSQIVDVFRKQVSIRCTAKLANQVPRVSINKSSCAIAARANWKWKFAFDQMKQYLQSLIVVFALAVPPAQRPEKKPLPGPKSKTKRVWFNADDGPKHVKKEGGVESKKENVPPSDVKVKRELLGLGNGDGSHSGDDDDHFGGANYSPPGSGPVSPAGDGNEDAEEDGENQNANDSDWSGGAASGNDSAGSDVEFSINTNTVRRWNLRRRKTRSKSGGDENENDSDTDYVPGTLPPLRRPSRGSTTSRGRVPESEKKFSCNLCSQKFAMERGLKRHLSQAHAFLMIYSCPKCPTLRFRKSKDLDLHKRKVHRKVARPGEYLPYLGHPTTCSVKGCEQVFPSKMKMLIHRRTTHKLTSTIHTCELCGKKVRGTTRFEYHMKTHTRPDKPHRCTKCPRGFGTEVGLKTHLKFHEDNPDWVPFARNKKKGDTVPREGVFKCDIDGCGKTFYKISNLTIHKSLHGQSFDCSVCNFKCHMPRDIRNHLLRHHEKEEKKFFCLHCDKAYTLEQTYDLHRKVAHPTKVKLCCDSDKCEEEFDNTEQLRQHLKTMHLPPDVEETKEDVKFYDVYNKDGRSKVDPPPANPPKTEANAVVEGTASPPEGTVTPSQSQPAQPSEGGKTEVDSQSANTFEDLLLVNPPNPETNETGEVVSESEPPRLYTCARCDWSFSRKIMYSLHGILHTPRDERRLYCCDLCDKAFTVVDTLQTHYNRIHGPKIKPYLCLVCGIRFHRKESFIPHMRIHRDKVSSQTFDCDQCDKKFFDSVNLHKHMRMVHQRVKFSRECDECQESFPGKLALLTHQVEVHGKEKPYMCKVDGCGKGYYTLAQLKDHKICHNEAAFPCTLCEKKFKRRHNLADHILVHKQEKNHFCEYCGRAFVKKSSLNLHLDIHRGIKKYTCEYCGKAFCRKFARDCHLRVHTKEKPFKCKFCGRDFAQYSGLTMHLKNHEKHNNDNVVRRPFKKSIAVGKPLRQRKKKKQKESEEDTADEEEKEVSPVPPPQEPEATTQKVEDSGTLYSGILHQAMKATFDINIELEMDGLIKEQQDASVQVQQQQNVVEGGGGVQVITELNAVTAVASVEQFVPKEESEEETVDAPPVSKKRQRRPKTYKKEYSCGFCGKIFHREDFYNKHVNRHMQEVESSSITSGGDVSQQSHQSSLMEEHNSLQEVLQEEPAQSQSLRRRSITRSEAVFVSNAINVPQPQQQQTYQSPPPPPPLAPAPVLPQPIQAPPKRRGRPPKQLNSAPGSRLARIVEDVLETATNRSISTRYQQHQYSQQQTQQVQSSPHHVVQSPSPHQVVHSGSERSTPTGSPAPNLNQQQHHQQIATTTSAPLTFPSSATSMLSPFLFSNPYLIPRMPDQPQQAVQQDPMFAGFPHRQQQQNSFNQHVLQQQATVNYTQQQFQQQMPSSSSSARTLPQDLSKNNYSIFYNNNHR